MFLLIFFINNNENDKMAIENNKKIKLLNLKLKKIKVKNITIILSIYLILFFKLR